MATKGTTTRAGIESPATMAQDSEGSSKDIGDCRQECLELFPALFREEATAHVSPSLTTVDRDAFSGHKVGFDKKAHCSCNLLGVSPGSLEGPLGQVLDLFLGEARRRNRWPQCNGIDANCRCQLDC